jgi:hypothetical protein
MSGKVLAHMLLLGADRELVSWFLEMEKGKL